MHKAFSIFFNSFFDFGPGHLNPHVNTLFTRFRNIVPKIKWYLLSEEDWLHRQLKTEIGELIALYEKAGMKNPKFIDFLRGFYAELQTRDNVGYQVYTDLWSKETVSAETIKIPNMLHEESYKYYKWLGKTWQGNGAIVELGCWMGATSACVMEGLFENNTPHKKEMFVFDSFKWSEEMGLFQKFRALKHAHLKDGDSFLKYFKKFNAKYLDHIHISESWLYTDDDTERTLPALTWNNNSIEIMILDFSPLKTVNEATWQLFSPSFIPGKTLLVFNQFGNLSANQLREFLRYHSTNLKAIHKPNSAIKTYLYVEPA